MRIFISHSHLDSAIADALRNLYESIFGDKVEVRYSSDQSPGGGIPPGTPWLDWVIKEVKQADRTIVVLTPRSLDRPWLLWESGAVMGVALGKGEATSVVPLLFKTSAEHVPGPLGHRQVLYGDSEKGLARELGEINVLLNHHLPEKALKKLIDSLIPEYLSAVDTALADQPLVLSEGSVQEWVSRLEVLRDENRWADVDTLETAMNLAFCPPDLKEPAPLDVRLHRHLGEVYLKAKRPEKAIQQFELALKLMPRDVYLLHKSGLAHLERKDVDKALEVLKRIETLSPKLVEKDAEIGGLAGRAYRARWEMSGDLEALRNARNAYMTAAANLSSSYYMPDVAGQLSLLLGETEKAKELFALAKKRIDSSGERSVWALATLATASFVLGEPSQTVSLLTELAALRPVPRDIDAIKLGLKRLVDAKQASADLLQTWVKILDGAS